MKPWPPIPLSGTFCGGRVFYEELSVTLLRADEVYGQIRSGMVDHALAIAALLLACPLLPE
jgi:hypothetical protein